MSAKKKRPARGRKPAQRKSPARASAGESRRSAAELARQARDISVSEFFAKNRHLLGFDNPSKALLTTVKEGVDNSLDACEEAGILPDIRVEIAQISETRFRVAIQDNGPGIVRKQVPKIFGSLLYGSKFHRLKQSRGQQGIGISAAGMYGLLTTGKPVVITTRTGKGKEAHHFELVIDTKKNEPKVKRDDVVDWDVDHGTRVEIELEGAYRGGQHSVDAYIRQISLANPHARIVYVPPKAEEHGSEHEFPRVSDALPPETAEIQPHPYGVELGVLMQMFRDTRSRNIRSCLSSDFSRVSSKTALEICKAAKVPESRRPSEVSREEAERVHEAIQHTKLMAPPMDCIAPIGEELIEAALRAEVEADFYASATRRASVYRGNPFLVEVGLAYGGSSSPPRTPITVYRYANRVPLQYQQGACAITKGGDRHRLEVLPDPCSRAVRPARGPHAAHGAHRQRVGALHLREQGGHRPLPGDHQGHPSRVCRSADAGWPPTSASRSARPTRPRSAPTSRSTSRRSPSACSRSWSFERQGARSRWSRTSPTSSSAAGRCRRGRGRTQEERRRRRPPARKAHRQEGPQPRRRPRSRKKKTARRGGASGSRAAKGAIDTKDMARSATPQMDGLTVDLICERRRGRPQGPSTEEGRSPTSPSPSARSRTSPTRRRRATSRSANSQEGSHPHREHGEELRPDPAHDGALEGAGGEQRLRHQARRLLSEQELGGRQVRRAERERTR